MPSFTTVAFLVPIATTLVPWDRCGAQFGESVREIPLPWASFHKILPTGGTIETAEVQSVTAARAEVGCSTVSPLSKALTDRRLGEALQPTAFLPEAEPGIGH